MLLLKPVCLATSSFWKDEYSKRSFLRDRPRHGQQASRYVWTRKVRAKTVTVALSEAQYHWLKQAVANQRELKRIVEEMQTLSRQILFENAPVNLGKRLVNP
jgi:hypothetical protein